MGEVHRLPAPQVLFSLKTAGPLMTKIFPQWVQDLALLVERRNRAASGSVARLAAGRDCAATLFDQTTHFPAAGELRCHRRCARGWAEMLASAVSCCLMPPTAGRSAWWQALTGCCEGANTRSK